MKILLIALFTLTCSPSFAQGNGGVSGPDTHGTKVNTDEKLLTRKGIQGILQDCISIETLDIFRILAKDNTFIFSDVQGTPNGKYIRTCEGNASTEGCNVTSFYGYLANVDKSLAGNIGFDYNTPKHPNQLQFNVGIFPMSGSTGKAFSIVMTVKTFPILFYTETSLPGAYDEYGNVIQDKILITSTQFVGGSTAPIQLYNANTMQPVQDVFFNASRYMSCINLAIGKYSPPKP